MLFIPQLCGIAIIVVILVMRVLQKRIYLKSQSLFNVNLHVVFLMLIMDALTVFLIGETKGGGQWWLHALCKVYLMLLVLTGYSSFRYICVDVRSKNLDERIVARVSRIFTLVGLITIAVLPINCVYTEKAVYTEGYAVLSTYLFALTFVFLNFLVLIAGRKMMDKRRYHAALTWMLLWIVAAMIQFYNNQLLLVGFASALGMVILSLKLESPEGYIDRSTGFYNDQAFHMYLDQGYTNDTEFVVLVVNMIDFYGKTENFSEQAKVALQKSFEHYFDSLKTRGVYHISKWDYGFIFENDDHLQDTLSKMRKHFEKPLKEEGISLTIHPKYIIVDDMSIAEDGARLNEEIREFIIECNSNRKSVNYLSKEWVKSRVMQQEIVQEIIAALDEDRVEVFYQPIYSTKEKRFVSAEALARIRNVDGTLMPPGVFIPVAEANGLIIQIGERVFKEVCRFIKTYDIRECGIQYIEVNLSAIQCTNERLAEGFIEIMRNEQIDPTMINLEITESAAMLSKDTLFANMEKLREAGVGFSLDDFGTGYSNLNYIMEIPVDIVKFDRNMTVSYFESEKSKLVMQAAIQMIKAVPLKIVSEGVEEKEQLEELEKLEIDYIQGFYFSKPVEEKEFIELLKAS